MVPGLLVAHMGVNPFSPPRRMVVIWPAINVCDSPNAVTTTDPANTVMVIFVIEEQLVWQASLLSFRG